MRTRPQQCFDTELSGGGGGGGGGGGWGGGVGGGREDCGAETLRASVSRTTLFIMPTLASVCSTGGRLQMVKISKRSVEKLKSYEH